MTETPTQYRERYPIARAGGPGYMGPDDEWQEFYDYGLGDCGWGKFHDIDVIVHMMTYDENMHCVWNGVRLHTPGDYSEGSEGGEA